MLNKVAILHISFDRFLFELAHPPVRGAAGAALLGVELHRQLSMPIPIIDNGADLPD